MAESLFLLAETLRDAQAEYDAACALVHEVAKLLATAETKVQEAEQRRDGAQKALAFVYQSAAGLPKHTEG
jgi:exonuclease VII small subunit